MKTDENGVRRLRVERILEEPIHPDIAQRGLSAYRIQAARRWLADGWGGFRVVDQVARRALEPSDIPPDGRVLVISRPPQPEPFRLHRTPLRRWRALSPRGRCGAMVDIAPPPGSNKRLNDRVLPIGNYVAN